MHNFKFAYICSSVVLGVHRTGYDFVPFLYFYLCDAMPSFCWSLLNVLLPFSEYIFLPLQLFFVFVISFFIDVSGHQWKVVNSEDRMNDFRYVKLRYCAIEDTISSL